MSATADPAKLRSYTSPRPDVAALLGERPRRVLDVGCSDGSENHCLFDRAHGRRNKPAKYLARGPLEEFLAYQYVCRLRPV